MKRMHRVIRETARREFQSVLDTVTEHIDRPQAELETVTADAIRHCFVRLLASIRRNDPAVAPDDKTIRPSIPNRRPACRCKSQFRREARPRG